MLACSPYSLNPHRGAKLMSHKLPMPTVFQLSNADSNKNYLHLPTPSRIFIYEAQC